MNCREIQDLLSGYIYDALSPEEQKEVSSHLEHCPHCSEELENLKKSFSMLECWEDREPPPALASATISALTEKKVSLFSLWLPRLRFAFGFIVVAYMVVMGGVYSLHKFLPMDDQQTLFNAPSQLFPEAPASFRIVVQTLKGDHPVKGAKVKVELQNNKTKQKTGLFVGTTDADGTVEPRIKVPSLTEGSYTIIVNTRSIRGKNTIQSPVSLERYCRILLSTDRPIYQPGQTIHIRSLAVLEGLRKAPESGTSVFEVEDPKGNKVFKKSAPVGAFGIASSDFILAREINTGNYRIRATIGKDTAERVVEVKRYVLPKFKIAFEPSRKVYRPGETITGTVKGSYFFGKSVQKGRVLIDLSTFDVAFHRISHLEGKTDAEGVFKLSIPLPSYFVGQPLEKGEGLLKCDISLRDSAGHEEKLTETLHVAETAEDSSQAGFRGKKLPITIDIIPEKKTFIPGIGQKVFVVTTLPGGASPLSCDVTLVTSEGILRSTSDRFGIAEFMITPDSQSSMMKIEAQKGNDCYRVFNVTLNASMDSDGVLLRTDKALYTVGTSLKATVLSPEKMGTVYLDVLRNDQIILTKALELTDGRSEMTLDLTDDCTGTLTINAYRTTNYTAESDSGITVRDTRMVTVFPSRDLTVSARSDKKTYRPGDKAHICYEVKDDTGIPVPAAIGVNIVDESVFALADRHPGLEKIYFAIEQEIMEPKIEVCTHNKSINISEITEAPRDDISTQRAAEVLFTALLQDRPINFMSSLKETQDRYWMAKEGYLNIVRIMIWIPAILVIVWLCVIYRTSLITVLKYCGYLVIAVIAMGALFSASRYLLTIKERQYNDCWSNLKNMGIALEMYSSDNQGRYPHSLSLLTPGYLRSLPTCPSAGRITYSYTWTVIPDCYTVWCNGSYHIHNHRPNFPEYDAVVGLYEKGDDCGTGAHESDGPAIIDTIRFCRSSNQGGTGTRETQSSNATQAQTPEHRKVQGSLSSAPDIRVRQLFPETLYWNPLVITDEKGKAEIEVPIADSITTWRMAATASTGEGIIGSTTAPLAVFQEFFIEPDLPEHLTRGDEITLPVAVYNYLPHPQKITVTLKSSDWFDTTGPTTRTVMLNASDVGSVPFTISVKKVGDFRFKVEGRSNERSDAVSKPIRVDPEGRETVVTQNGNMEKRAACSITIPPDSVPGGSTVLAKIYPAMTTQIVDGLDGMLRMPYG
ncbi:MAG: MG2 domain-containing protein [Vulcanimicrobiota bacterium]